MLGDGCGRLLGEGGRMVMWFEGAMREWGLGLRGCGYGEVGRLDCIDFRRSFLVRWESGL